MAKFKFKDVSKQGSNSLWMFSLTSIILLLLIVFLGLWNTNWDFQTILPGYGRWTVYDIAGIEVWQHVRIIDGVKVVPSLPGATFDIGILVKGLIVQTLAFILYFNERTRGLLKKAMDLSYIVVLKVISKFKSLQADPGFRELISDLDLKEKKDTWKLLAGLKLEHHLQSEDKHPSLIPWISWLRWIRIPFYKSPLLQRVAYPDKIEDVNHDNRKNWSRSTIKFVDKEEKLIEQISDTWIDEHIRHISFTYPKITVKMILTGNTSVKISRMAIEDVKSVKAKETRLRILSNIMSLAWLVIIGSITSLSFRYNTWKAILDMLIYSFPIAWAYVFAVMSSNKIHDSKENEVADRIGYITKYVGVPIVKETKKDVITELSDKNEINRLKKTLEIKSLEEQLAENKLSQ